MKSSPEVQNALIRVEGVQGAPPKNWENPSDVRSDFWVMELDPVCMPLRKWIPRAIRRIRSEAIRLSAMRRKKYTIVLHIQTAASPLPTEFPAHFIRELARQGIALEHTTDIMSRLIDRGISLEQVFDTRPNHAMERTADPRHASCVRTCRATGRGPLIADVRRRTPESLLQ